MKRVFKGWVPKTFSVKNIAKWNPHGSDPELLIADIYRRKEGGGERDASEWPPKKCTITVEVED